MKKSLVVALFFALCLVNTPRANAAHSDVEAPPTSDKESLQCISLIRECFSYHGFNRSNCFFTSATHPFCHGSELGSLAYRRWVLAPNEQGTNKEAAEAMAQNQLDQQSSAQAFLGPQVVDTACIKRTDEALESNLRIDSISIETVRKLTESLEKCKKDIGLELRRQ